MTEVALAPLPTDIERETIRYELSRIAEENAGYISPEKVVEAASNPESLLHSKFLWDDTEAGYRFRLTQAAMLLRRIRITVVRPELKAPDRIVVGTRRAIESDPERRGDTAGSYAPVEMLMSDADKRAALLKSVTSELKAMRKRYDDLHELATIWVAVDALPS